MINYIITDEDGFITKSGGKSALSFSHMTCESNETIRVVSASATGETHYWDQKLVAFPNKPFEHSVFNMSTKAWEDPSDLSAPTLLAVTSVNSIHGRARTSIATNIPFQGELYAEKRKEAIKYLDQLVEPADLTDYPFLAAEVGTTAPTANDLALVWLYMDDMWVSKLAELEADRISRIEAIESATTLAEIEAAVDNMDATISLIVGS